MIFFVQSLGILHAQNLEEVKEAVVEINKIYKKNKRLSQEIMIQVFPDWESQMVIEERKGWMKKEAGKQRGRFEEVEYVSTEKAHISLDHQAKLMIWMNNGQKLPQMESELDMDELLMLCSEVNMKEEGEFQLISFHFMAQQFDKIQVLYQKESKLIRKIRWYYAQAQSFSQEYPNAKGRMEMSFSNIDFHPQFEPETFSLKQFIGKNTAGESVPTTSYKDYQLISY